MNSSPGSHPLATPAFIPREYVGQWCPLSTRLGRSRVRVPLAPGCFRGRVIPVTEKLPLQWLPCQAPGVIWSSLGLVGPMSVYSDWVRWKVDMQLLSQCGSTYNCLSRTVPEIYLHVAGTLSSQLTTTPLHTGNRARVTHCRGGH